MIQSLTHARDVIRIGLTDTPSHIEACSYVDGWCGAPLRYTNTLYCVEAWARGRAERWLCEERGVLS